MIWVLCQTIHHHQKRLKQVTKHYELLHEKHNETFPGSGPSNVGFLSACVRDDITYTRDQFYETEAKVGTSL